MKYLLLIALVMPIAAKAEELWFTASLVSHHFSTTERFNERNPGLGIEYEFQPKLRAIAGGYLNSNSRHSTYFGALWTPVKILGVDLGGTLGMVNGYPINDGRYTPAGTLLAMYERNGYGLNLQFIPRIANQNPAVLALQVKWRFP